MSIRRGAEETRAFYFANYRLLTDEGIANHESTKRLSVFLAPMPYTHTFTLRLGDVKELEEKRSWALGCPLAYETERFTIHDTGDSWAFVNTREDELRLAEGARNMALCSRDYGELTAWGTDETFDIERKGRHFQNATLMDAKTDTGRSMEDFGLNLEEYARISSCTPFSACSGTSCVSSRASCPFGPSAPRCVINRNRAFPAMKKQTRFPVSEGPVFV